MAPMRPGSKVAALTTAGQCSLRCPPSTAGRQGTGRLGLRGRVLRRRPAPTPRPTGPRCRLRPRGGQQPPGHRPSGRRPGAGRPPRRHPAHPARNRISAGPGSKGDRPVLRLGVDDHHPTSRRGGRMPQPAHPSPDQRRRTGLLPLLDTPPGAATHPGPGRRNPVERGDLFPDRQAHRPGRAAGAPLGLLVPAHHPGDARPRHPHRHRRPRTRHAHRPDTDSVDIQPPGSVWLRARRSSIWVWRRPSRARRARVGRCRSRRRGWASCAMP
jgi:hypothetical protein